MLTIPNNNKTPSKCSCFWHLNFISEWKILARWSFVPDDSPELFSGADRRESFNFLTILRQIQSSSNQTQKHRNTHLKCVPYPNWSRTCRHTCPFKLCRHRSTFRVCSSPCLYHVLQTQEPNHQIQTNWGSIYCIQNGRKAIQVKNQLYDYITHPDYYIAILWCEIQLSDVSCMFSSGNGPQVSRLAAWLTFQSWIREFHSKFAVCENWWNSLSSGTLFTRGTFR